MQTQKPKSRFLNKQSSLQVPDKSNEDSDNIRLSPRGEFGGPSIIGSRDLGSITSKQEFVSFSTTMSSQSNIKTKSCDICPFCSEKISEVEVNLYCESLHLKDFGTFFYHNDCWRDSVILNNELVSSLKFADYEFKEDSLLPKAKGELSEDFLLGIKIYHPISNIVLGKILANDLLVSKNEQIINFTCDFKSDSALYQIGSLVFPLSFLRISFALNSINDSDLKIDDREFFLQISSATVNKNKQKNIELLLYGRIVEKLSTIRNLQGKFTEFLESKKLLDQPTFIQIKRIVLKYNIAETLVLDPIQESSSELNRESSPELASKTQSKNSRESISSKNSQEDVPMGLVPKKDVYNTVMEIHTSMVPNLTMPLESLHKYNTISNINEREEKLIAEKRMEIKPPTRDSKGKKKSCKISTESNLPSLEEIRGQILEIAMNQSGSRTLQRFVEKANQVEIEVVLMEILPHLNDVIKDDYANYMFQAICLRCTPKMRIMIIRAIAGDIVPLAMHKKGTHSLQALISAMNSENETVIFMSLIAKHISLLSCDHHGTYFIQKIVFCFSNKVVRALLEIVLGNFEKIVSDQYGVCVIKAIINKYCSHSITPEQAYITAKIVENIDYLIQDPFANYAVKQILDKCEFNSVKNIVLRVLEKFLCLSVQKFSSYIVEKCLILFYKVHFQSFQDVKDHIHQIINEEIIAELSCNNYGCHVLKTMVECMAGFDKQALVYMGTCIYSIIKSSQSQAQKEFLIKIVQFIQKF